MRLGGASVGGVDLIGWIAVCGECLASAGRIWNAAARRPMRLCQLRWRCHCVAADARLPTSRWGRGASRHAPLHTRAPRRSPPSITDESSAGLRGRKYGLSCPDLLSLASMPARPLHPASRGSASAVRVVIKGGREIGGACGDGASAQTGLKNCAAAVNRMGGLGAVMGAVSVWAYSITGPTPPTGHAFTQLRARFVRRRNRNHMI